MFTKLYYTVISACLSTPKQRLKQKGALMAYFRKAVAILLCISMLLCIFACGKEDGPKVPDDTQTHPDGNSENEFNPYPYADLGVFMDLPDYKNVSIPKSTLDEMVNAEILNLVDTKGLFIQIFDRKVQNGDKVQIDFVGMLDDVAFEGGTASDYELIIGSKSFIDGFEDGVIGMEIGDVKDLTLRFPNNYPDLTLAGKEVIFTVTLDEIWEVPEITDELCKSNTPYQTAEEYLKVLKTDCSYQYAYDKLLQQCKIKAYPDEYTEYYQKFVDFFTSQASDYSVTLEDFLKNYGDYFRNYGLYSGMSTPDFYRVAENYAESNLANDLLMYSILRAEGIKVGSAEFETAKARLEAEYNLSYEELIVKYEPTSVIISILNIALANKLTEYVKVD